MENNKDKNADPSESTQNRQTDSQNPNNSQMQSKDQSQDKSQTQLLSNGPMPRQDKNKETARLSVRHTSDDFKTVSYKGSLTPPAEKSDEKTTDKPYPTRKRKRNLFLKYIVTTMILIVSFLTLSFVAVFGFIVINGKNNSRHEIIPDTSNILAAQEEAIVTEDPDNGLINEILEEIIVAPRKTNILLLGLDQSGLLSDVTLAVSFDSKTKKVDVISIPRDTYVSLTQTQIDDLNEAGKYPPRSMKITELHSYAGEELGYQYSMMKAEELLGVEIDYYAEIRLDAFREVIDAVGGLYMDIPDGGLYYNDPIQDLHISVPEGRQLLTGKQAEGVVRYRATYRRGDLDRIDMQKLFMKELFTQVVNKDTIMNNLLDFAGTVISYVRTDFGLDDIPQYLTSLDGLSGEHIRFHTLPGVPQDMNGGSYYVCDKGETDKLVADTFLNYSTAENGGATTGTDTAPHIQLLNGGYQSIVVSGIKETLTEAGYLVTDAGDYVDVETKTNKTRILTKKAGDGEDLVPYFENAAVQVDPAAVPDGFDLVVIIGKSE